MNLIIVESPTKARTFNRLLKNRDYYVFATLGHIRDLPTDKIAINYQKNFQPNYEIVKGKKKVVDELKKLAKKNNSIILATDLDREGESIAYHVAYILGYIKEDWPEFSLVNFKNLKRIIFHEITPQALEKALQEPTTLRTNLIKAQQGRRILDRIVGYELSPLLWKKAGKNWLSAGRVQTVALRLIVEREKEIKKFVSQSYFQIYGEFSNDNKLMAKLVAKDNLRYEIKKKITLFAGEYEYTQTTINKENLSDLKKDLLNDRYQIKEIKETIIKRYPPPPYTTSLLQQDGFHRFGFSSKMVMKIAQDLYESGLITYHRTDSFNLATSFVFKAADYIKNKFGQFFALDKPRYFKTKSKMAQEAHEAIRPTNLKIEEIKEAGSGKFTINHKRLYSMIFNRAVSSQMKEAEIKIIKVFIVSDQGYLFESEFQKIVFPGFLKLLNPEFIKNHQKDISFKNKEKIQLINLESKENFTQPPPRYNEASLIKIMEEKGIGRPSTYAPIISLIQSKGYVEKENRYFIPTILGTSISDYLSSAFSDIFEINFTAMMENSLDQIAEGEKSLIKVLNDFYQPFKTELEQRKNDHQIIHVEEEINEKCPKCGNKLTVRYSRYGKFYACTGYPQCTYTKPFLKFVKNAKCPLCQGRIVVKYSRSKKRFYGCENYPKCNYSTWKL
ncbi:MAG: type I DNA topoisomerase [Microgenomates group bacterium]|nr:type I DNA topoisomerase [Microgenomates group bacterium]